MLVRPDTLWLDDVIERLETSEELLPGLDVAACDLVVDRGDRIEVPRGPGRVTVRNTAALRLVRDAAALPVGVSVLAERIAEAFPGVQATTVIAMIQALIRHGVLITSLRAPMTVTDPLGHVIKTLGSAATLAPVGQASTVIQELRGIQQVICAHNAAASEMTGQAQARLRASAAERMRRLSPSGRATLAGDLHLDCAITVPADLATEMARAVTALVRLTRQPRPDPAWNDWCREFWERYGTGTVVPVTDAVHPDSGLGRPSGFPASMLSDPEPALSQRDEALLRLAWDSAAGHQDEVVLTDEAIAAVTAAEPVDPRWIPPHAELGARVRAVSEQALQAGDYTFTVHPAWSFGTLTSRFGPAVVSAGLDRIYAATIQLILRYPPLP